MYNAPFDESEPLRLFSKGYLVRVRVDVGG
jgi:hypothetical protein